MSQHKNPHPYQSSQLVDRPSLLDPGRCLTFILGDAHVFFRVFFKEKSVSCKPENTVYNKKSKI